MAGIEGALRYFDGVPVEILIDNPKAMVIEHNRGTHDVILNETFKSFCVLLGFYPSCLCSSASTDKGEGGKWSRLRKAELSCRAGI